MVDAATTWSPAGLELKLCKYSCHNGRCKCTYTNCCDTPKVEVVGLQYEYKYYQP